MVLLNTIAIVEATDGKTYPIFQRIPGKVLIHIATDSGSIILHGQDVDGSCAEATGNSKRQSMVLRAKSDSGGVEVLVHIRRDLNGKLNSPDAEEDGPVGYFAALQGKQDKEPNSEF